ncbi:MAG: outer membrane protein [Desulfuromonadaceae bacterium]
MIKIIIVVFIALLSASPAVASYDDIYPYVGVTLGSALTSVNKLSDTSGSLDTEFNPGFMVGGVAGIAIKTNYSANIERISVEAEVGYRSNSLDKMKSTNGLSAEMDGSFSVTNYMLNLNIENSTLLSNTLPMRLFITAGVGAAVASIDSIFYQGSLLIKSAKDTQFAYQGGLGVGFDVTQSVSLETKYRYLGTSSFKFDGVNAEYGSHNILFGVRYAFK